MLGGSYCFNNFAACRQIVQATAERVRKVAVEILDQLDTVQISDGTPPGLTRDDLERAVTKQAERRTPVRPAARKPEQTARPLASVRGL